MKLLREPGFLYDLIFLFYLKFNTDLCLKWLENNKQQAEAQAFFSEILDYFDDIPEDLYLFFHAKEKNICFFTIYYFSPYRDHFTTDYNIKFLQNELTDKERLKRNIIKYYFHDLSDEDIDFCMKSNNMVFSYVKQSKYSSEEKNKLYEFFINPDHYIQTLQFELMSKSFMLSQYYEKNYQKVPEIFNRTTFDVLKSQMKNIDNDFSFIEDEDQNLYLSFCLINRYCIYYFFLNNETICLLGTEYVAGLESLQEKRAVDLQSFGSALAEKSRINIIEALQVHKEVTCKDLEKMFCLSPSTAYHHVTLMYKSGLVKTRSEGKTIYYSLNTDYLSTVIEFLKKLADSE